MEQIIMACFQQDGMILNGQIACISEKYDCTMIEVLNTLESMIEEGRVEKINIGYRLLK